MRVGSLSVVIPAFGDGHRMPASLARLAQELERTGEDLGRFEVIIVDDASADLSVIRINEALRPFNRGRLIRLPWKCGSGIAMRAGVATATSEHIAITGPDQRLDAQWLATVVQMLGDADLLLTAANASPAHPSTRPGSVSSNLSRRLSEAACNQFASRMGTPAFPGGQRLAALRTDIAKPMFALLGSPGVDFDVEAHVVMASMGLRIGHIPPPKIFADEERWLPHPIPRPGAGAVVKGLLRARRHRSRALRTSGLTQPSQLPRRSVDDAGLVIDLTDAPATPSWKTDSAFRLLDRRTSI